MCMIISEQTEINGKGDRDMKKILCVIMSVILTMSLSSCALFKGGAYDKSEVTDESVTESTISLGLVDVDTYNPIYSTSPTVINLMGFVFEPLFSVNEDGTVTNILAESYTVSPDGKSVVVKLKQNVKCHDGSTFICPDILYTVDKIKNSNSRYFSLVKTMKDVIALDYNTLKVTFEKPTPNPAALLSFPIIKGYSADGGEFRPVGTGPYVFNGDKLDAYDTYHGGIAKISVVDIKSVPDEEKYISMFNASVFDVADSNMIDMKTYTPKSKANVQNYISNRMIYVGFNSESSVFRFPEARRSVSKLIDRKNIASHIYFSGAEATAYPINPMSYVYPETEVNLYRDETTAEEILKENGWELNTNDIYHLVGERGATYFTVSILVNGDDESRVKIAEELSETMNRIGMFNTVTKCNSQQFISRIESGSYDMFIGETELTPNGDLSDLLSSDNVLNYKNQDCDALLSQIGTLTEDIDIKTAWENLADLVVDESPFAPICFIKESIITSARIKSGVYPSPLNSVQRTENWSLQ